MRTRVWLSLILAVALCDAELDAQAPDQGRVIAGATQHILSERERPAVINQILQDRLKTLLPRLMRETGFDMWLVINREYVEDPVYLSLVPAPVFHARRLSMLVFYDRGDGQPLEILTVSRYPMDGYAAAWTGGTEESQWKRLAAIVAERTPKRIGINTSRKWSFGDGLTGGLRDGLMEALGPGLAARTASAEALCVRWLETRTPRELDLYAHMVAIARGVVSEAFSARVITPGVTTTADVEWYIRQRFTDLGVSTWFSPDVDRQAAGTACTAESPFCGDGGVIQRRRRVALRRRHHLPAPQHRYAGDGLRAPERRGRRARRLDARPGGGQSLAGPAHRRVRDRPHRQRHLRADKSRRARRRAPAQHVHASGRLITVTPPARRSACGTTRAWCR